MPDRQGKYTISPVVGYLGHLDLTSLVLNKDEVSEVFTTPLCHFLDESNVRYTRYRNGWTMPVFVNTKHSIWGLTAVIIDSYLSNVYHENYSRVTKFIKPV